LIQDQWLKFKFWVLNFKISIKKWVGDILWHINVVTSKPSLDLMSHSQLEIGDEDT
jgi:hypothetical protein